ncbi:hypothetical protein SAMN06265370_1351, partial [Puniceibacterium sediminis]
MAVLGGVIGDIRTSETRPRNASVASGRASASNVSAAPSPSLFEAADCLRCALHSRRCLMDRDV